MNSFEITLERVARNLHPHFIGIAICSLILLFGAVVFRFIQFFAESECSGQYAVFFQTIAFLLAGIPLLCRAVLPNIDKLTPKKKLLARLISANSTDWSILPSTVSHNLPYPSFYYAADTELKLIPVADYGGFREPWLDDVINRANVWDKNSVTKVDYQLVYHGIVQEICWILLVDGTRFAIPMPISESVQSDPPEPKYTPKDYKVAKMVDNHFDGGQRPMDIDAAIDRFGMASLSV